MSNAHTYTPANTKSFCHSQIYCREIFLLFNFYFLYIKLSWGHIKDFSGENQNTIIYNAKVYFFFGHMSNILDCLKII